MVGHISCDKLIRKQLDLDVLDILIRWLNFIAQLLILVVLLIIDGVINTSDWNPVVNASLIDASGQRVLWHVEIGCQDQSLSSFIILLAGISQKLPDFLLSAGSCFPELFSPLLKGML